MKQKLIEALEALMTAATEYNNTHKELQEHLPEDLQWHEAWKNAEAVLKEAKKNNEN